MLTLAVLLNAAALVLAWRERRQRQRLEALVHRIMRDVYPAKPVLPPPPTRAFEMRLASWEDDRLATKARGCETFLPVDFRHSSW
jgi:hypothetical protein